MASRKIKKTNVSEMTKRKTKKFSYGGVTSPLSMAYNPMPDDSATGSVKQISKSAQRAQDQLGQAAGAIGSGGGGGVGPSGQSIMPGGGSLLPPDRFPREPYAKGGKIRGYGKARGGRPCKMV